MKNGELNHMAERMLSAWNTQDVDAVLGCYTEDVMYRDPNTRGEVKGAEGMRRYLTKLFSAWKMHWSLREAFPLSNQEGAAVLWHASFQSAGGGQTVEADGMDLVLLEGEKIKRNEVYFDRAVLAPLLGL